MSDEERQLRLKISVEVGALLVPVAATHPWFQGIYKKVVDVILPDEEEKKPDAA